MLVTNSVSGVVAWQVVGDTDTSVVSAVFDQSASLATFSPGVLYTWCVTLEKGSQAVTAYSSFVFCLPSSQAVETATACTCDALCKSVYAIKMYVYICVCVTACVYVYVCMCVHVHVFTCAHVCMCVRVCEYVRVRAYDVLMRAYVYINLYVRNRCTCAVLICVCAYACMRAYMW